MKSSSLSSDSEVLEGRRSSRSSCRLARDHDVSGARDLQQEVEAGHRGAAPQTDAPEVLCAAARTSGTSVSGNPALRVGFPLPRARVSAVCPPEASLSLSMYRAVARYNPALRLPASSVHPAGGGD